MKRVFIAPCVLLLVAVQCVAAQAADALDLRRGVPDDVYMVVQAMHNPERDFQKKYYDEVWKTVQETEIIERVLNIATSRMPEEDLASANAIIEQLREATAPIDLPALAACKEMIYAQQMMMWQPEGGAPSMPASQHLLLVSVTEEVAASTVEGVKNLFALAEKYSGGDVYVEESKEGNASVVTLVLPPQLPVQPTVAHIGEVFVFCTSKELLKTSLDMMTGTDGKSKFDDPRLAEALAKLPKAEDSLVFYDGRTQFETLNKIGPLVAQMGGEDENIKRIVKFIDMVMKELSVFDYEVTVEYTEDNLNRSATYGKLIPGTDDSTLRKMLSSGEQFEKWQSWVPAGALSYSMGTGVNLHILYERIMSVLEQDVPEATDGLAQFAAIQEELDLYLDRDILQAFSGEYATLSVITDAGSRESVTALRCHKPDRIRELIHRGIEEIGKIEQMKMHQLKLVECKDLEGFDTISAMTLAPLGISPVIGFNDGWMYIGQSVAAVKKVLDTKAGEGETIDTTDAFKRLRIEVDGPVDAIKYANTAENTRALAGSLKTVGNMVPLIMAMAGPAAQDEAAKPVMEVVSEVLALLPDVAKIVEKFDFLEANITVVQQGPNADSYFKRSVTVVRPADQ